MAGKLDVQGALLCFLLSKVRYTLWSRAAFACSMHPQLGPSAEQSEPQTQIDKKGWSLPSLLKPKQPEKEPEPPKSKWGLFDWAAYNQAWEVKQLLVCIGCLDYFDRQNCMTRFPGVARN